MILSRAGGSRTHTRLPSVDFKSTASAIPPPPRGLNCTQNKVRVKVQARDLWEVLLIFYLNRTKMVILSETQQP